MSKYREAYYGVYIYSSIHIFWFIKHNISSIYSPFDFIARHNDYCITSNYILNNLILKGKKKNEKKLKKVLTH